MLTHPITKRSVAGWESSCSNDLTSAGGSAVPIFHVTMCSLNKRRRHKQSRNQSINESGSYKLKELAGKPPTKSTSPITSTQVYSKLKTQYT